MSLIRGGGSVFGGNIRSSRASARAVFGRQHSAQHSSLVVRVSRCSERTVTAAGTGVRSYALAGPRDSDHKTDYSSYAWAVRLGRG